MKENRMMVFASEGRHDGGVSRKPGFGALFRKLKSWFALMIVAWCGSLCASITLSPTSQTVSASGGSYSFTITYTGGLSYQTPSFSDSWIHNGGFQVSTSTGGGTITVKYSVDANTSSTSRSGTIYGQVSGVNYTFYVNQPGQGSTPTTQKYVVTFYGGGKTLGSATMEKGKNTNQAAASVYHPTRAGYELTGWADASGNIMFNAQGRAVNGKYWNGSYVPSTSSATWKYSGNVTAYAQWRQLPSQKYTVTFYGGGKTLGSATMEVGKNTNQAAPSLYHPTRVGYVLTGWYDASGNIIFDAQGRAVNGKYWDGSYPTATWKYSGNVTAYAYWALAKYTVTFYGGGRTLGTASVELGKNTNQAAASLYKPTRAGYRLIGWADASGNIMFNAQGWAVNGKYWNGSYVPGQSSAIWKYSGNVTAYAYWEEVPVQEVPASGGNSYYITITYTGSLSWQTPSVSASWIKLGGFESSYSNGGGTIKQWYSVDANTSYSLREGKIYGTACGEYFELIVRQYGRTSNSNASAVRNASVCVGSRGEARLFAPGEFTGTFADGGVFMLTLDPDLASACLATWTDYGDAISECEVEVVDGTLLLTTENGEIYRMVWDGGSLVATRIE